MSDDYVDEMLRPLREKIMKEVKKSMEMIVQVDCSMQVSYISKEEYNTKIEELEEKIGLRLTVTDFNDSLQQFDDLVKDEN